MTKKDKKEYDRIITEKDDLAMMRNPEIWPHMCLPLVKREGMDTTKTGLLVEGGIGEHRRFMFVEGANLFMGGMDFDTCQRRMGDDELLTQLLLEGWSVD